ncbi:hypothetical protein [Clostridium sp. 'White wine YQ']|uniref:hypothetical protein n=1 Tax=Clostridium sp. 'White wine YQ' TaxID=3027474 RepID=UPI002366C266|nr:hypothetical protein [Clostridium sp. 'White wine YQ']MDD7794360.1 hypothetical protein [Clostridium sp. 'White wine YQ']
MDYYFENNKRYYKFKGKLHKKIILGFTNYTKHIVNKHPEINISILEEVICNPDYIYKTSINSEDFYYEKVIGEDIYRVVISRFKKNVKEVITAYKSNNTDKFTTKHIRCIYDKKIYIKYEDFYRELEYDIDYFYEAFSAADD